ncbi:MAG TPA: 5-deoxy-glucuronate isomerase, partial [Candidatus Acidoferrum sp.]|nr:5-deoxy-glucuronate isomerase [Candidatus Acidoferrum sp.]
MSEPLFLVHSQDLAAEQSGELLHLDRGRAGWKWMSMSVRRLQPGDIVRASARNEECAFVLLGGKCVADWGEGPKHIGKRA